MKNQLSRAFLLLGLLLLVNSVFAQQTITVSGKVTSEDGQPIPLTGISVSKKGIGTATNSSGMFALMIPAANQADSLKISHIGYNTKYFAISGLNAGVALNVVLEKSNTELKEVTVTFYDADKIIQKAITAIPQNYINHAHVLRGFYRLYAFNNKVPLQLSEAVFDVYNFGYGDKHADIFRLIKARSEKNDRHFNSAEFTQKPNNIFEQDIVNHLPASGFLSETGLTKHEYYVSGITDVNGIQAYEIDFKEKAGVVGKTYRGKMFVDTKTLAFVYFDFGVSPSGLKSKESGSFIEKTLSKKNDVKATLMSDHLKVSYQEVNNKWVLANVDGDNTLAIKSLYLDYDYTAHVKYNYQITEVDMKQKESFDSKMGRNESINSHKSNTDQKFWKDYNILLADNNADDIFKQIKDFNKEKEKEKLKED